MSDERSPLTSLSRRQLLGTAFAVPLLGAWSRRLPSAQGPARPDLTPQYVDHVRRGRGYAVGLDGQEIPALRLERNWSGATCRSRLTNPGATPVRVKEVVLFQVEPFEPNAALYAESFQMLSQTGGMLMLPRDLGSYTDAGHYKIPAPEGTRVFFGVMAITRTCLQRGCDDTVGFGFASTRKFAGAFRLPARGKIEVVVDTEGLTLDPGESWDLEEFVVTSAYSRDAALAAVGRALEANHPRLRWPSPPTGWCSWYCFGAKVTAQNILDNLDVIAAKIPGLTYVQIDDGYQPAMGDWLEAGPAFGGDIRHVLDAIRTRGFQPAIWVAPFVAEKDSRVFQQHPDWFVRDGDGAPLRSDRVTFGGWRRGPWYVLDGTHPDVQAHFEHVFATMHRDWGVTYFKLDANFWGAIHGGRFHDPRATRIEAYRRGMQAILRGAGDSFILGCNHPIWPSAGLIHGSRSSNDIKRDWNRIKTTAQQNLLRNWQNGLLWWNDPDAVCLAGALPDNEFVFHATAIYATGGMVLSGDDLTQIPEPRLAMLKKLLPPTGVPAVFDDQGQSVGRIALPGKDMICLFNWGETTLEPRVALTARSRVRDFWSGQSLGRQTSVKVTLPPHSARLLECTRG